MKNIFQKISMVLYALFPLAAFAQTSSGNSCSASISDLASIFTLVVCYISKLIIPLIFGLTVLVFIWGVLQYVMNADNEEKRQKGREFMLYGIIALFVMTSIWGLVSVLSNTFGVHNVIPQLQSQ